MAHPNEYVPHREEWVGDRAGQRTKEVDATTWWRKKKGDVSAEVFTLVRAIDSRQATRLSERSRYRRLFIGDGRAVGQKREVSRDRSRNGRLTLNVLRSCCTTVTAKIAKNRPRPQILTDDGDWDLQQQAKQLTKWLGGTFHAAGIYEEAPRVFAEQALCGTGALRIFVDEGVIRTERAHIDELRVDDEDARYGKPRELHQVRRVRKDVLLAMFSGALTAIKNAPSPGDMQPNASSADGTPNMCEVVESWHLPSRKDAKDGRHTICVDGGTLLSEPYTKMYFPFVFLRWTEPDAGFWGAGLGEELIGIQLEINVLLRKIQEAHHLLAVGRVFVDNNSNVDSSKFTNAQGGIVKGDFQAGLMPVFQTPAAMQPEVYQHLERLYQRAYEITGISQLSANSQKPAGLDSGRALREYQDIESERFVLTGQRYENMFMDAARIMIDMARDLYEDGTDLVAHSRGGDFIESINWSDVDLEDDQYEMQVFPVSLLPTTPQGRLQTVTEMIQAGFIEKEHGMSLLDFPDVKGFTSRATAALNSARATVARLLKRGSKYDPPEPYINMALTLEVAQTEYLVARDKGASELALHNLRMFMDALVEKMKPPAPPPSAEPPPPPMPPPDAGLPPPLDPAAMMDPGVMPTDPAALDPNTAALPALA